MATASILVSETPLVLYALRRADDALILGHRLSEWCGHAPAMEEDMALANMGLDLLGQARELYSHAAKVEGKGNDEDKFAYLRDVRQYRNLLLVEQPCRVGHVRSIPKAVPRLHQGESDLYIPTR